MKICLVLEGGGNRGVYTSGVLDCLLDNEIYIPNVYGVSAGALNAMSYLSRQKGRSYRINKDYVFNDKCINYKRVLKGNILDLDYLFNQVNLNDDPLDLNEFDKNKENYVVVCSDIVNGSPIYKKIEDYHKDWAYIKASGSLPLFSKIVRIDGFKLLDGGLTDSIPVVKAIEDGYDKVIVVLTRDKSYVCKPYKFMNAYKTKYARYPRLINAMENRFNKYNVTRDLIEKLESDKRVFVIQPSEVLDIANLERNESKLERIYNLGYNDAKNILKDLEKYLKEEHS